MNPRLAVKLLRLVPPAPKKGVWGALAEPVITKDTDDRIRAQSILCGIKFKDGTTSCPPLTLGQARDVLRWIRP